MSGTEHSSALLVEHNRGSMVLTRLREETAALHQEIEGLLDLASPTLTVERYGRVLQGFEAFLGPWERAMGAFCPAAYVELWQDRERLHLLHNDLKALGMDGIHRDQMELPSLEDSAVWLGSLYVLEGSRLGGHHISRHLERHFGWRNCTGYQFFWGDGERSGHHWKQVCAALEKQGQSGNQITHGAHLTFGYLLRTFRALL